MNDHIFGDLTAKSQNWDTLDVVRNIADSTGVRLPVFHELNISGPRINQKKWSSLAASGDGCTTGA